MLRLVAWRWLVVDALSWLFASVAAAIISADLVLRAAYIDVYVAVGFVGALLQVVCGLMLGVYRGRHRPATFDDLRNLTESAVIVIGSFTFGLLLVQPESTPKASAIAIGTLALVIMILTRAIVRSVRERTGTFTPAAERVILFGAGEAGEQLARSVRRDQQSRYRAVAFLDDAPEKRNLRLENVPVAGNRESVADVAHRFDARTLIVSIANADAQLLGDLSKRCDGAGLHMLVVPSVPQLVSQQINVGDVRELDSSDLLGRAVVEADVASISDMLQGKRVLVTGAGGSIGSELARQIDHFGPAQLLLLDRDESGLHAVQLSMQGNSPVDSDSLILADIRDRDRMHEVFASYQPEVVFHAAALKHVPLLEVAPQEALKTNIIGTRNILEAAEAAGVAVFVNISTDKAANPCNVLGFSKRVTERLTAGTGTSPKDRFISVRFGNVLGSRGSVLTTFTEQIERGGPITVTHPEVTRYFMTIQEAVLLVLQASVLGDSGEVLILEMGDPMRINDVAERLINHSGKRIELTYTGLRAGEKLHEDLIADGETAVCREHPKIMHVHVEQPLKISGNIVVPSSGQQARNLMQRWALRDEQTLALP